MKTNVIFDTSAYRNLTLKSTISEIEDKLKKKWFDNKIDGSLIKINNGKNFIILLILLIFFLKIKKCISKNNINLNFHKFNNDNSNICLL